MATYLFWDPVEDNVVQERDATGALTAEYTTEPDLYGNIISQNRQAVESNLHYDAIGSTLAVTAASQQVIDTRGYSAFGEIMESSGSTVLLFQYIGKQGYYLNHSLGQILIRRREFAYHAGRWLSTDPIGPRFNNMNKYCYSGNSPIVALDPSGLECEGETTPLPPPKKMEEEFFHRCETHSLERLDLPGIPPGTIVPCESKPCDTFYPGWECYSNRNGIWCLICKCSKYKKPNPAVKSDSCCGVVPNKRCGAGLKRGPGGRLNVSCACISAIHI